MNRDALRPRPAALGEWLEYIERVHPQSVAMGLDRVAAVRDAMGLAPQFPVIAVGGTNGKGSACAMLEAILVHAGYRTGLYTSPHLLRYNERVRVAGREADDARLVAALGAVEDARGMTPLTYFEFGTLAAVWLFEREQVDVAILEVGLGGRLDAVNAFDAAGALVTSVALDHMEYLGATREEIGREKAGIFRAGCPAVCADPQPPDSLLRHAARLGTRLLVQGVDFGFETDRIGWRYWGPSGKRGGLPLPTLRGACQLINASGCLALLDALREPLPVAMGDIRSGLLQAENPARFQVLPGRPAVILDVAHNPHAAAALVRNLREMERRGRTLAVFSMLKDKDIAGVIDAVKPCIDHWYVAGTAGARGADAALIQARLAAAGAAETVTVCPSIGNAYAQACEAAEEDDKILVFGSFLTVAAVMAERAARPKSQGGVKL